MHFNASFLFAVFLITLNCFSQDKSKTEIADITKVSFLSPGVSYEKRTGKFQSVYARAFTNISGAIGTSMYWGNHSVFYFDPALTIQYRYYYNAAKREAKGRRTEMNSLNYIAPVIETVFSKRRISSSHYVEENRRSINTVAFVWGFQRNYKKRFSFDFNLGPGYLFTKTSLPGDAGQIIKKNTGQFTTAGQLSLGFWLNKLRF